MRAGASVDPRRGDADDPLAGVVHIQLSENGDVCRWKWEAAVIARAEPMTVFGVVVPVPLTSDLILLKLAAGGYLDLRDAAALLSLGDRATLVHDVEQRLPEVHPDVRPLWRELLAAIPDR